MTMPMQRPHLCTRHLVRALGAKSAKQGGVRQQLQQLQPYQVWVIGRALVALAQLGLVAVH